MPAPNLTCCFSLRTGGLILAILDIMIGIYTIIFSVFALGLGAAFPHIMDIATGRSLNSNETGTALSDMQQVNHDAVSSLVSTVMYVVAALFLVDGVVTICWGSILVHGIRKESANLMKIWMIFRVITLIFEVSISVFTYTYSFSALEFFEDIFGSMIGIWLILIVHFIRKDIQGKYKNIGKDNSF